MQFQGLTRLHGAVSGIIYDTLIEFERQGKSLDEFEAALPALLPELDETALAQVIQLSLSTAYLSGMDESTDARR